MLTYCGIVNDDVTAGHIAMENVLLQVLDKGALQSQRDKAKQKKGYLVSSDSGVLPSKLINSKSII